MNNFMKFIVNFLLVVMLSVSAAAWAEVNTGGLTPEQSALLEKQAAEMKIQNAQPPAIPSPTAVEEWAGIGKEVGVAIGETAKALNTEVNSFAKSPVGIWAIVLITYKMIGMEILKGVFGVIFLFTTIPTWLWMFNKRQYSVVVEYDDGGKKKTVTKEPVGRGDFPDDEKSVYVVVLALLIAVGLSVALK